MAKLILPSIVALVLMTGSAFSQTTTTESTSVTGPAAMQPPAAPIAVQPGTQSTTETQRTVDSNGNEVDSTKTTYSGTDGAASETTTTAIPATPQVVTTKKTTTISTSN